MDLLVFRIDWEDGWGTERMVGHPVLEPEMARACADHGLSAGIDALSPDSTGDDGVPAHHAILGTGLPAVENLCGLNVLPTDRAFDLYVMPFRMDTDGVPAWVVIDTKTRLIRRRDER